MRSAPWQIVLFSLGMYLVVYGLRDRKGMQIGWGTYFQVGIVLTIPVLALTLLAPAGWLTLLGP